MSLKIKEVKTNPCIGCGVHCCSRHLIDVCGYDAWRITRELGVKHVDFLAFAQPPNEVPYDFQLDGSGKSHALVLNMVEQPDSSRRCIFGLNLLRGQFRCGIYGLRPFSCRVYPLTLQNGEIAIKPRALCPQGAWSLDDLDLTHWKKQLGQSNMEFGIYALLVAGWNKQVEQQPPLEKLVIGPFVDFLDFVMDIYDELEVARAEIPPDAWPQIWNMWADFLARGENPLGLVGVESKPPGYWKQWLQDIHRVVEDAVNKKFALENTMEEERAAEVCCV